ncbi:MAG: hypothetical protein ACYC7D_14625 [Nitrososphaerales archaeon]
MSSKGSLTLYYQREPDCDVSAVKLRKRDKLAVHSLKGQTGNSEVVGLAQCWRGQTWISFLREYWRASRTTRCNIELLRKPARRGKMTDAKSIEEYLYG